MYRSHAALRLMPSILLTISACSPPDAAVPVEAAPLEVVVDHLNVPSFILNDEGVDLLRLRIILKLRNAGIAVAESVPQVTWGSFLNATSSPVERPTLLVSLNMVPDGSTFIVNFYVKEPVLLVGEATETTVITHATHSYAYDTRWTDHSPVLNYLDDVIGPLRGQDER